MAEGKLIQGTSNKMAQRKLMEGSLLVNPIRKVLMKRLVYAMRKIGTIGMMSQVLIAMLLNLIKVTNNCKYKPMEV
jgi:hypothetical protein